MYADKKIRFRNNFDVCLLKSVYEKSKQQHRLDTEKIFVANPLSPARKSRSTDVMAILCVRITYSYTHFNHAVRYTIDEVSSRDILGIHGSFTREISDVVYNLSPRSKLRACVNNYASCMLFGIVI